MEIKSNIELYIAVCIPIYNYNVPNIKEERGEEGSRLLIIRTYLYTHTSQIFTIQTAAVNIFFLGPTHNFFL